MSYIDMRKNLIPSIKMWTDVGVTTSVFVYVFQWQDYWFSLVFKRLVGPRVLAVRVAGLQRKPQPGRVIRDKLRIYAHCTSYYKYVGQFCFFFNQHLSLNPYCMCNSYLSLFPVSFFRETHENNTDSYWCVASLWEDPWTFRLKTGCRRDFFLDHLPFFPPLCPLEST